jgi:hypothetical protein
MPIQALRSPHCSASDKDKPFTAERLGETQAAIQFYGGKNHG